MQKPIKVINFIAFRNKFYQARYRWRWTGQPAKRIAELSGVSLKTARRWELKFKKGRGK